MLHQSDNFYPSDNVLSLLGYFIRVTAATSPHGDTLLQTMMEMWGNSGQTHET